MTLNGTGNVNNTVGFQGSLLTAAKQMNPLILVQL
jgi:hypothetical protein